MKSSFYLKNKLLIGEVFLLGGAVILIRAFWPGFLLPRMDLPVLTVLSVIPMILSAMIRKRTESEGNRLFSIFLAGATLALLPFITGWSGGIPLWKLFFSGTAVFGITDVIYTSMADRIFSGNRASF